MAVAGGASLIATALWKFRSQEVDSEVRSVSECADDGEANAKPFHGRGHRPRTDRFLPGAATVGLGRWDHGDRAFNPSRRRAAAARRRR